MSRSTSGYTLNNAVASSLLEAAKNSKQNAGTEKVELFKRALVVLFYTKSALDGRQSERTLRILDSRATQMTVPPSHSCFMLCKRKTKTLSGRSQSPEL